MYVSEYSGYLFFFTLGAILSAPSLWSKTSLKRFLPKFPEKDFIIVMCIETDKPF